MSQEAEEKSPTVALVDLGRWFVLFTIGFQLIANILELFLEGGEIRPLVILTHVSIAVASTILLWRPWIGLCIGLLPLVFVVITGDAGADPVFFVLAAATFAFRYGVRPISTVVLLGTGYGGIRNLVAMRGLDGLVGQMLDYTFLTVFGVFLGLAFKGVLAVLERREVRLAILAGDIVEIRSGERLRLAGELRRVVGERLEEAWKGHKAPRRTSDTWALRDAIERVQTVCLDAVTRVRALVGMLREDPVADGSDESKSIIGSVQILSSAAEALRLQGLHVDLKVDEELDRRSVLTQLTATRVAQLVLKSSDALRPDPLRFKVECPSSYTTRMMVELVTPNKLRSEDKSAFERVRERVQSLGGQFSKGFTGRGHLFEIRLPESRYGEVDDAAAVRGKRKSLGRKILGTAMPLLFMGIMALRTCLTQPLGWALTWREQCRHAPVAAHRRSRGRRGSGGHADHPRADPCRAIRRAPDGVLEIWPNPESLLDPRHGVGGLCRHVGDYYQWFGKQTGTRGGRVDSIRRLGLFLPERAVREDSGGAERTGSRSLGGH